MLLGMHQAEAVHRNQFFVDRRLWKIPPRRLIITLRYTALVSALVLLALYSLCSSTGVGIAIAGDMKGLHHTLNVNEYNAKTT